MPITQQQPLICDPALLSGLLRHLEFAKGFLSQHQTRSMLLGPLRMVFSMQRQAEQAGQQVVQHITNQQILIQHFHQPEINKGRKSDSTTLFQSWLLLQQQTNLKVQSLLQTCIQLRKQKQTLQQTPKPMALQLKGLIKPVQPKQEQVILQRLRARNTKLNIEVNTFNQLRQTIQNPKLQQNLSKILFPVNSIQAILQEKKTTQTYLHLWKKPAQKSKIQQWLQARLTEARAANSTQEIGQELHAAVQKPLALTEMLNLRLETKKLIAPQSILSQIIGKKSLAGWRLRPAVKQKGTGKISDKAEQATKQLTKRLPTSLVMEQSLSLILNQIQEIQPPVPSNIAGNSPKAMQHILQNREVWAPLAGQGQEIAFDIDAPEYGIRSYLTLKPTTLQAKVTEGNSKVYRPTSLVLQCQQGMPAPAQWNRKQQNEPQLKAFFLQQAKAGNRKNTEGDKQALILNPVTKKIGRERIFQHFLALSKTEHSNVKIYNVKSPNVTSKNIVPSSLVNKKAKNHKTQINLTTEGETSPQTWALLRESYFKLRLVTLSHNWSSQGMQIRTKQAGIPSPTLFWSLIPHISKQGSLEEQKMQKRVTLLLQNNESDIQDSPLLPLPQKGAKPSLQYQWKQSLQDLQKQILAEEEAIQKAVPAKAKVGSKVGLHVKPQASSQATAQGSAKLVYQAAANTNSAGQKDEFTAEDLLNVANAEALLTTHKEVRSKTNKEDPQIEGTKQSEGEALLEEKTENEKMQKVVEGKIPEIIDKVLRKIERKQTINQERRGGF